MNKKTNEKLEALGWKKALVSDEKRKAPLAGRALDNKRRGKSTTFGLASPKLSRPKHLESFLPFLPFPPDLWILLRHYTAEELDDEYSRMAEKGNTFLPRNWYRYLVEGEKQAFERAHTFKEGDDEWPIKPVT